MATEDDTTKTDDAPTFADILDKARPKDTDRGGGELSERAMPNQALADAFFSLPPLEWPEPNEIEKKISKVQLELATRLSSQIGDPRVSERLFSVLPTMKMSSEDQARFTQEYSKIKQTIGNMALKQKERAMGQQLDDLVERGVLSPEAAEKQRMKNEAATNAVISITNKKLDAARIGMAREAWTKDAAQGFNSAGIMAEVDQRNRQIYNGVISQALTNIERKAAAKVDAGTALSKSAMESSINRGWSDWDFNTTMAEAGISAGRKLYDSGAFNFGNSSMNWMNSPPGTNKWSPEG